MKIEILAGGNIEKAFKELNVNFVTTYSGDQYKVCEIDKKDMKRMEDYEGEWPDDWGWWSFTKGSNMGTPYNFVKINGRDIICWEGDGHCNDEYNTLLDYMSKAIGASQPRNVCALAVDLARANGMSMSELFKIYQR